MYNILFDTNVLLDSLDPARPESDEACSALFRCNGSGDKGFLAAHSLADVFYIVEKHKGRDAARTAVKRLMDLLIIAPLTAEHCDMAYRDGEKDFEAGLIRATAELEGMDYIITRDKEAFTEAKVPRVTAAEYLSIAEKDDVF